MRQRVVAFLTILILGHSCATSATIPWQQHKWNQPPSAKQLKNTPGLVHQSFDSKLMKTTIGYNVVLPPSYESEANRHYPVVYWLHGGGGNESSDVWNSRTWRRAFKEHSVGEVILVYLNGGRSSYWDHHDGKTMIESVIVKEIIPHVDANFRTIAKREARAVHGFSMGASGGLKFAIKYPELFCACVAYGGGAIDLEKTQMQFIRNILKRNLNSDPALIAKNNTYRMLRENADRVKQLDVRFLLICGEGDTWKSSATEFQEALREKNLECELKLVPNVGHDIGKLIRAEGVTAAKFQDEIFKRTTSN